MCFGCTMQRALVQRQRKTKDYSIHADNVFVLEYSLARFKGKVPVFSFSRCKGPFAHFPYTLPPISCISQISQKNKNRFWCRSGTAKLLLSGDYCNKFSTDWQMRCTDSVRRDFIPTKVTPTSAKSVST